MHKGADTDLADPNQAKSNKVGVPVLLPVLCAAGGCEALGTAALYTAGAIVGVVGGGVLADLINMSKARDSREGDGTRNLDYDGIRQKFKDKLSKGPLEKLIQQVQKQRGERNAQKRK